LKNRLIIFLVALLMSCIDPISIQVRDASGDLVVEAWLYDREGESYVKLSNTAAIGSNPNVPRPVSNAVVELFDQQNTVITFEEQSPGNYKPSNPLYKAEVGLAYVLRIVTDDNTVFESDAEVMQASYDGSTLRVTYAPREFINASGNVSFEILVDFLVDIAKPPGSNVYYNYSWEGTYTAISPFQNRWEECPTDGLPDDYEPDFEFDFCYITEKSSQSINILSTEGFEGDVFRGHKLVSLNPNKRFLFRYSMLAKQYSLSRRAYNYLKAISDQSDNVGSLFDPPPSIIPGNIRSISNNDKKVFGYFFVSSVNEFRDFFGNTFIPVPLVHYETCDCYPEEAECIIGEGSELFEDETEPVMPYCCDCRLIPNSTTIRPDFWIN
jgi:hypothetical protein